VQNFYIALENMLVYPQHLVGDFDVDTVELLMLEAGCSFEKFCAAFITKIKLHR
jgi:hypothetical protein